jgi:RHS repeat-associated protein
MLTDTAGNIAELYEYDAFGQPYIYTPNGNLVLRKFGSPAGNRFLFTGREWLKDVRVYDFRARLYQPELGRFLQPDPKQFEAGDYNLYRYCNNDPVNRSDPTGLNSLTMFGGGDWIKGSDGLSAWDRTIGGMPSNRWEAGPYGSGGGETGGKSISSENEGKKQPFVKTTAKYEGGNLLSTKRDRLFGITTQR